MRRAYSFLEVKALSEDERIIEGIATTPSVDRVSDVVESSGATFRLPIPLLLDHNHSEAVGEVELAVASAAGVTFRARIAKIEEPGAAKDLVDRAWHYVKSGLRKAVSIGFRPIDSEPMGGTGGMIFRTWEWLELSLVTIPANPEATIQHIKKLDRQNMALRGNARIVRLTDSDRRRAGLMRRGPVVSALLDVSDESIPEGKKALGAGGVALEMITVAAKAADAAIVDLQRQIDELKAR